MNRDPVFRISAGTVRRAVARRGMVRAAAALISVVLALGCARAQTNNTPPGSEAIDRAMNDYIRSYNMPGAAIALAKDGRLVLARGYGWADSERGELVRPDSLFRIGSISKTITAIGVMRLVEGGKLELDAKAFEMLSHIRPRNGKIRDSRVAQITVRHLLQHSGGWDATKSGDPMTGSKVGDIADDMHVLFPASCETTISWMLDRDLDFNPGTRYSYSNFGFCVLGRIIEKVTGQRYEDYIRSDVLAPLGLARVQQAKSQLSQRAEGEVRYYDYPGAPLIDSFFPGVRGKVPIPYSGLLPFESLDSVGAWIASAADLARIFVMLDSKRPPLLLRPETVRLMLAHPPYNNSGPGEPGWYGFGIASYPAGSDAVWWHNGGGPGFHAFAVRMPNGYACAAVFNSAPMTDYDPGDLRLHAICSQAALESATWPKIDLFPEFHPSGRPTVTLGGVVNSASGLSGPIAPGELVSIYGTFLGPPQAEAATVSAEVKFPFTLANRQVLVNGSAVPLLYVSASQINAVVPFKLDLSRPAEIRIKTPEYESEPVSLAVAAARPAVFVWREFDHWHAAALNQDGSLNTASNPAPAGSFVAVYATGLGVTAPASEDGAVSTGNLTVALPVRVFVDGVQAEVSYAGGAPGMLSGVSQINFRVPAAIQGTSATVVIEVAEFRSPDSVLLTVRR